MQLSLIILLHTLLLVISIEESKVKERKFVSKAVDETIQEVKIIFYLAH